MRGAGPDRGVDIGNIKSGGFAAQPRRTRVRGFQCVEQVGNRSADCVPIRRPVIACRDQRCTERGNAVVVTQFGQTRPVQQRAQRRIAKRGFIKSPEMRITTAGAWWRMAQDRIADVVKRRSILGGSEGAKSRACDVLKAHKYSRLQNHNDSQLPNDDRPSAC